MIFDVLARLTRAVEQAVDDGYYRDFTAAQQNQKQAPSLVAAVRAQAPWAFLAEAKPASPSRGDLSGGDPVGRARDRLRIYHDYGVSGISVLTERDTFHGSLDLLAEATAFGDTPVLMKDFVVHDDQLDAAQAAGASAVLLIHHLFARGKSSWELPDAIRAAHDRGLEVLLEVDDPQAFEHAVTTDADIIGINNRDLRTLEMNKDRTRDILRHRLHLVPDRPVLALSGVETRVDVQATHEGGATGVLVGTTLMEAERPRATLRHLRGLAHVKCCGAGHPDDDARVRDALGAADAVGCVVRAGGARRERTLDEARALFASLPKEVERIVVTTDPDPVWLDEAMNTTGATGIQLHTPLDRETLTAARDALGPDRTLIALVRVPRDDGSSEPAFIQGIVESAQEALTVADRLLIDAPPRPGGDAGGTGEAVDWTLARRVVDMLRPAPIVLAGGLTPENVALALRRVRPWGVDVSSGIETDDRRKDPPRIIRFCRASRTVLNLHDPPIEEGRLRVL